MSGPLVRFATEADADDVVRLVKALAVYEKFDPEKDVKLTREIVLRDGFTEPKRFEVLIGEVDGKAVGYLLFFYTYSTFAGHTGIYIEDVFVEEAYRGRGLGKKLITTAINIATERGCPRVDLQVLDWNQPSIDFYVSLGFEKMGTWLPYRLTKHLPAAN
eukprot:comp22329_c0_seq1/m.33193 comp22329_c0_seq1/g.33193  ORF comp22329_c0_seq1/g.33193 comp22329_c0_seq1/m.33193 type:complete len:160 (-) comp22329_c0_seq1:314-793(-)